MAIGQTEIVSSVPMLANSRYRDEVLTFAAAGPKLAGTLLARAVDGIALVPFVKGAVDSTGVPLAILAYDLEATAPGNVAFRAAIAGEYRKQYLIIEADGDDSNIDNSVLDALRDFGLVALDVHTLGTI